MNTCHSIRHALRTYVFCIVLMLVSALSFGNEASAEEIHDAAENGNLEKVKSLLQSNPGLVYRKDSTGRTALHYAAMNDTVEIAEALIVKRADVNTADNTGTTPLHLAANSGNRQMVELLLASGASLNPKDKTGLTPLLRVVLTGRDELVEVLLSKGADPNLKDNEGNSPLLHAVLMDRLPLVTLLVARGADVNAKNLQGWSPLGIAAKGGEKEVEKVLRQHGAHL
jgi:ankyrin repeat protein